MSSRASKFFISWLGFTDRVRNPVSTAFRIKVIRKATWLIDSKTGTRLFCDPQSLGIATETWYNGDYDLPELSIGTNDIVLDVGAHHGFFTCYMAQKGAVVYAFEPHPQNAERWQKNVAANEFPIIPQLSQVALGSHIGTTQLFQLRQLSGAMHSTQPAFAQAFGGSDEITVEQRNLDKWLAEKNYPLIRLLKLDCEGAEWDILQSLSTRALAQIDAIIMEYHPTYDIVDIHTWVTTNEQFYLSMVNHLPQVQRHIIKLVNKRVWNNMHNYHYQQ